MKIKLKRKSKKVKTEGKKLVLKRKKPKGPMLPGFEDRPEDPAPPETQPTTFPPDHCQVCGDKPATGWLVINGKKVCGKHVDFNKLTILPGA